MENYLKQAKRFKLNSQMKLFKECYFNPKVKYNFNF